MSLELDPTPWWFFGAREDSKLSDGYLFKPREGYSQERYDYTGEVAETLGEWLERHADPNYKPWRFPNKRKGSVRKFNRTDVAGDAKQYEYSFGFDYRTVREPVTLSRFIELTSDPNYKPWRLPVRRKTSVSKLSAKARLAESARIAHYVSSKAR